MKRTMLSVTSMLVILGLLIAGCGTAAPEPTAAPAVQPTEAPQAEQPRLV